MRLDERYYKAALYVFRLDRAVIPYLKGELRRRAKWYALHERWSSHAKRAIEPMICIVMYDLEKGGRTTSEFRADAVPVADAALRSWLSLSERATDQEKADVLGIPLRTWYRLYAKPYDALYADVVGWAMTGRRHVYRMENIEELLNG